MAKKPKATASPDESGPLGAETEPTAPGDLRDERLLLALLAEPDIESAAKAAKVGRSTAFERLRDPEFRSRLKEMRRAREAHALARLSDLATSAVLTLGEMLNPDVAAQQGASARVNAARAVLDFLRHDRNDDVDDQFDGLRSIIKQLLEEQKARRGHW